MLKDEVLADVIAFIESNNELLFNERDFQMHLAIWLRNSNHYDDVDVEYYVPYQELDGYIWKNELRLDILVSKNGEYLPVELKYKTKGVQRKLRRFDEELEEVEVIKNQGAKDWGMYNFWKDVRRIELVRKRFPNVKNGLAVFLTNDQSYLNTPKKTSNNYAFRMVEGLNPAEKHWHNPQSASAKTHPDFEVEKEYEIQWKAKTIDNVNFNYCIVTV